jgi:PDZ domain-containing protein
MMLRAAVLAVALILPELHAAAPGAAASSRPAAPIDEAKLAGVFAGRMVQVEALQAVDGGKDKVFISSPATVIGTRQVLALSPRLKKVQSGKDVVFRISVDEGGGAIRKVPARLVHADGQTGLSVLEADDLRSQVLAFASPRTPSKNEAVVLVEQGKGGRIILRRAEVVQGRAYLDQGNGKNPLLLVKILDAKGLDAKGPDAKSAEDRYTKWDNDQVAGSGTILADLHGGFLGLVTPPALNASGAKGDGGSGKPSLKEGEVLVLPSEIARFVSESLAQGKAPSRGYFGASFREADPPDEVRHLGSARPAVRVEKVYSGSPAEEADLQAGDWLMEISEKRNITYADVIRFSELVEYGGQGKTVRILVARGSAGHLKLLQLKIRIGER